MTNGIAAELGGQQSELKVTGDAIAFYERQVIQAKQLEEHGRAIRDMENQLKDLSKIVGQLIAVQNDFNGQQQTTNAHLQTLITSVRSVHQRFDELQRALTGIASNQNGMVRDSGLHSFPARSHNDLPTAPGLNGADTAYTLDIAEPVLQETARPLAASTQTSPTGTNVINPSRWSARAAGLMVVGLGFLSAVGVFSIQHGWVALLSGR